MEARDARTGREKRERAETQAPRATLSIVEASAGMLVQDLVVKPSDVVFVKGIVEASDGIAVVFAERGGDLTLAAPQGRGAELVELLRDLERDVGAELRPTPGGVAVAAAPRAASDAPLRGPADHLQ